MRFVQTASCDAVQINTRSSMTAASGVRCLTSNTPGLSKSSRERFAKMPLRRRAVTGDSLRHKGEARNERAAKEPQ